MSKTQTVKIFRYMYRSDEQGTPGKLIAPGFNCATLELPWDNNRQSYSCIPPGKYKMSVQLAKNPVGGRKDLYLLEDVPDRSEILIHAGNWAGDRRIGKRSNSKGCPLLGKAHALIYGQKAVSSSQDTVELFMTALNYEPAILEIVET